MPDTPRVVELLANEEALRKLCLDVTKAKVALMELTAGAHPIVYAIRVERAWFDDYWPRYIYDWQTVLGSRDLRCPVSQISASRFLGKVSYPNGAEANFLEFRLTKWEDVLSLTRIKLMSLSRQRPAFLK